MQAMLTKRLAPVLLLLPLLGAAGPAGAADCPAQPLPAFSSGNGSGWVHVPLSRLKRDTVYSVSDDGGEPVLQAVAEDAASVFAHMGRHDPATLPLIEWRWRTNALITKADNTNSKLEDAPVRVLVAFDGDVSTLPEAEQRRFKRAKDLSGRNMPFAMLMYIWENKRPVGTVIPSAHTSQVKMIVAESGAQGVGSWRNYQRNLVDDYRRAFGSAPGPIIGVGVMTDTDNTDAKAEGFYGVIRLTCAAAGQR
jgi:hypothetical protein